MNFKKTRTETGGFPDRIVEILPMIYIDAEGGGLLDLSCALAHEFGHVIQWAVDKNEEVWLVEGFSELSCLVNNLRAWYSWDVSQAFAIRTADRAFAIRSQETAIRCRYGPPGSFTPGAPYERSCAPHRTRLYSNPWA